MDIFKVVILLLSINQISCAFAPATIAIGLVNSFQNLAIATTSELQGLLVTLANMVTQFHKYPNPYNPTVNLINQFNVDSGKAIDTFVTQVYSIVNKAVTDTAQERKSFTNSNVHQLIHNLNGGVSWISSYLDNYSFDMEMEYYNLISNFTTDYLAADHGRGNFNVPSYFTYIESQSKSYFVQKNNELLGNDTQGITNLANTIKTFHF